MASIIGILQDRRGNILPNQTVIVIKASTDPGGTEFSGSSDDIGSYNITVSDDGAIYNIYQNLTAGGATGPNFIGKAISSGGAVGSSFVLCGDGDWKTEHYGSAESESCGGHKSINADDLTLRTGSAFIETVDDWLELRVGVTLQVLRITGPGVGEDNVFWFDPFYDASVNNNHIGLLEAHDSSVRNFYLGTAKTYWIRTDGQFNLFGGTFNDDVSIPTGDWTVSSGVVFTFTDHPKQSSYVAPTAITEYTPKKYVDDLFSTVSSSQLASVRLATTTSGTLASDFENGDTVDGVVLVTGDRLLIKDQASGIENGIYVVPASGAPARAADLPAGADAAAKWTWAQEGSLNADTGWLCTNNTGSAVVGTDSLAWAKFSQAGGITETLIQEMHKVTAGEISAGFFTLASTTANKTKVRVTKYQGLRQINKEVVAATGATPDFDVLDANLDRVHIANVVASGLSLLIIADDIVIIDYPVTT